MFEVSGHPQAVGERLVEFVQFLDYEVEIRRVIYSTIAIESLNTRMRRATRARGHFPNEPRRHEVPLPCDPVPRPDRKGSGRWMNRWKPALNAFEGRIFPTDQ